MNELEAVMNAVWRSLTIVAAVLGMIRSTAIAGDVAYGEYLSGECITCHQESGADDGIPSIIGWDEISFVAVMHSYKTGDRDNEAMRNVARSLDRDQIVALAAYFATLKFKRN